MLTLYSDSFAHIQTDRGRRTAEAGSLPQAQSGHCELTNNVEDWPTAPPHMADWLPHDWDDAAHISPTTRGAVEVQGSPVKGSNHCDLTLDESDTSPSRTLDTTGCADDSGELLIRSSTVNEGIMVHR